MCAVWFGLRLPDLPYMNHAHRLHHLWDRAVHTVIMDQTETLSQPVQYFGLSKNYAFASHKRQPEN